MVTRAQKRAPDAREVAPLIKRRNATAVETTGSVQEADPSVLEDVSSTAKRSPDSGGVSRGSSPVIGVEPDPPTPIVSWETGKTTFEKEQSEKPGFKIALWNVNGIRAVMNPNPVYHNKAPLLEYVKHEEPDILCLNETKIDDTQVTNFTQRLPGYKGYFACSVKKGYAGVATFVRQGVNVTFEDKGLGIAQHDTEGRVQTLLVRPEGLAEFYLVNTYVVNASRGLVRLPYKLNDFSPALYAHLNTLRKKNPRVIWVGDLNVAYQEIDIWNSKSNLKSPGHTPEERKSFGDFLSESRWTDVFRHFYPNKRQYTYWSAMQKTNLELNKGWRLDYYVVSDAVLPLCQKIYTRDFVRGSDHCPIVAVLCKPEDVGTEEKPRCCDTAVDGKGQALADGNDQPQQKTPGAGSLNGGEDAQISKENAEETTGGRPACEDPQNNSPGAKQEEDSVKPGVHAPKSR